MIKYGCSVWLMCQLLPPLGLYSQSRDRATLHSIIQQHTLPKTVVHTDEWAAYGRMTSLPNITSHAVVNHSLHFVDPVTGSIPITLRVIGIE